jgi:hypothetical protein
MHEMTTQQKLEFAGKLLLECQNELAKEIYNNYNLNQPEIDLINQFKNINKKLSNLTSKTTWYVS